MLNIKICSEAIDINKFISDFNNTAHGAVLFFFGNVRSTNNDLVVNGIKYDAHVPLAEKIINDICDEAKLKHDSGIDISIIHRIGELNVGEASVAIGVSSMHREEAFRASKYIIDELKLRVPIWKEEHYVDGKKEWLDGNQLTENK